MGCQLKRDVNPFVVVCFLVAAAIFLRKTGKPQKHKLLCEYMYICILVTVTTVCVQLIRQLQQTHNYGNMLT